jgi:hypothetical protein
MMKPFVIISILMLNCLRLMGQQQTKTWVNSDGSHEVLDSTTGMTETEKDGKTTHVSATDMTAFCSTLDDPIVLLALKHDSAGGWTGQSELCDAWGEVQPKTHIERMPFAQLMTRLLSIAPPSTKFARYRGMELKSGTDSTTYDATILPNDLGYDASCTVEEEDRHQEGMLYTYQCSVKTPSFPAALQLRDRLVQTLNTLHLTEEDEVREHGLATNAHTLGYCAPNGECMEGHIYVTTMKDWKIVQIEPNPDFTRNTLSEVRAMQAGGHAPINGIATDSATFTFRIVSIGPNEASKSDVGHEASKH